MGNKNYIGNKGIIKPVEFVHVSNKGKASINAKNTYLLGLAVKALKLEAIGCQFVVDRVYKHDFTILTNNTTTKNSAYDDKNTIDDKDIVNVLNMVNLFINDRQLLCRNNNNGNLIIVVVRPEANLILGKSLFIREKNHSIVSTYEVYDLVSDKVETIESGVKKGIRLMTEDDKKEILKNFNACNGVLEYDGEKINFTSYFKKLEVKNASEKNAKNA